MSLESSQGITDNRPPQLQGAAVERNRKAALTRWRNANPDKLKANLAKALAVRRAKAAKRKAKKQSKGRAGSARVDTCTLNLSPENKAAFDAFRNGEGVNFAFSYLVALAKGKKLVAKPVAVEYSVE